MILSAVINTWNEEKNLRRVLSSIKDYVDEIVIVDMESKDKTLDIAREFDAKIWSHPYLSYVEPARNFAINKAQGQWILLLDADEEMTKDMCVRLGRLISHGVYDYYRLPRKNIIFGKWISHSGWWPDYQIRLFKKGSVVWQDEIHSIPITQGKGIDLRAEEKNAIIHYHYENVSQYLERLNRYTSEEAKELIKSGHHFDWKNLIQKPISEFLSRFFVWEGYKDSLHGLALSILQAVSFFIVQLKVWEADEDFQDTKSINLLDSVWQLLNKAKKDFNYWYHVKKSQQGIKMKKYVHKLLAKFRL